tara:strand:- start:342 stop:614 length:273 start_codon:yes stop_codon:yes gene_type:complete
LVLVVLGQQVFQTKAEQGLTLFFPQLHLLAAAVVDLLVILSVQTADQEAVVLAVALQLEVTQGELGILHLNHHHKVIMVEQVILTEPITH